MSFSGLEKVCPAGFRLRRERVRTEEHDKHMYSADLPAEQQNTTQALILRLTSVLRSPVSLTWLVLEQGGSHLFGGAFPCVLEIRQRSGAILLCLHRLPC
jgi:hypothetical protein